MLNLYFKDDGTLFLRSKFVEEEAEATYTKKLQVPDSFVFTVVVDGDEEGMTSSREKTYDEILAEITYSDSRAVAYPALAEQLDKLYHDIENGTLDQTGEFFTVLKAVKDANPKP